MKHLLLTLIFSTSLTVFSQLVDTTQPLRQFDVSKWGSPVTSTPLGPMTIQTGSVDCRLPVSTPDTLRAIILATMCRRCAAEAIQGYVVIEQGKRPVYLDCRKRALKGFKVGWGWVEVGANKQ